MPKPNSKTISIQEQIRFLNHRLQNTPHGIPHPDLPTEQSLIDYMIKLFQDKKAIWVKHPDAWHFVLLREGQKPPMGISKWVWE